MNKSMLAGIGIGVAAALGVAAVASLNVFERGPQYAQVVSATPIKESVKTPRQECRNVTVTHRKPVQDENRIAGFRAGRGGRVVLLASVWWWTFPLIATAMQKTTCLSSQTWGCLLPLTLWHRHGLRRYGHETAGDPRQCLDRRQQGRPLHPYASNHQLERMSGTCRQNWHRFFGI